MNCAVTNHFFNDNNETLRTFLQKKKGTYAWILPINCAIKKAIVFSAGPVVSPTYRSLTLSVVPLKKWNERWQSTKRSDTHAYSSFFKPLIRVKKLGNWTNTLAKRLKTLANRTLAKRLVGETTVANLVPGKRSGYEISVQLTDCLYRNSFLLFSSWLFMNEYH